MSHPKPTRSNTTRVLPSSTEPAARGFVDFIGGPPGRHALIGRANWWTPLRILLAVAAAFTALGWLQKANCTRSVMGAGGPVVSWSGNRQYTSGCYTDIVTLYGSRGLDQLAFPYLHSWQSDGATRYMEYPVLSGVFQWLSAVVARPIHTAWDAIGLPPVAPGAMYFAVCAFFLAAAWIAAVGLVSNLTGNRVWDTVLMAASPLVIVHIYTNFDALSVLAAVAALSLWAHRRPAWAGAAGGLGIALKLWPAFLLGALVLLCIRHRAWVPMVRMMSGAIIAWIAVNLPIMILAPKGWGEFFRLNSQRGWEGSTLYAVIAHIIGDSTWSGVSPDKAVPHVGVLNVLSFGLLAACLVGVAVVVFFSQTPPRVGHIVFLTTLAFLVTNKVWSPQYSLWLVPLMVLAVPRWRLVFAWGALEAVYWYVRLWQFLPSNQAAPNWLADTLTVVRFGLLFVMAGLVIREAMGRGSGVDKIREAHGGRDPLAGPLEPRAPGQRDEDLSDARAKVKT